MGGVGQDTCDTGRVRLGAALILMIATTNFFNRLNVSTRQPAGDWAERRNLNHN